MAAGFKELHKILHEYADRAHKLSQERAKVGILDGKYEDGTPVAYIGAIQEFGAPERGIPARPYFRPAIAQHKNDWAKSIRSSVKAVVEGKLDAKQVLDAVGAVAEADIKQGIADVQSPPLSPITLMLRGMKHNDPTLVVTGKVVGEAAARVAAGETNYNPSDKPLEDTFTLFDSISHSVD